MMAKKERDSNIELLRIISMILIVYWHYFGQGGVEAHVKGLDLAILLPFCSGGRIAVNLFLMAGCWFLCDSRFRPKKILLLWGETFFYATTLTVVMAVITGVSLNDFFSAFFPLLRHPLWFVSVYCFLMLFSPFLQYAFRLPREQLRVLIVTGFVSICVISTVSKESEGYVPFLCWFMYVYLFIGYYKKYLAECSIRKEYFLAIGLGLYIAYSAVRYFSSNASELMLQMVDKLARQYGGDSKSLPNFICALCIFLFFTKLKMPPNRTINRLASATLAVYSIHQVPAFYDFLWYKILRIQNWYGSPWIVPYFLASGCLLYIACFVIDMARKRWLEPLWERSQIFSKAEKMIGDFYAI